MSIVVHDYRFSPPLRARMSYVSKTWFFFSEETKKPLTVRQLVSQAPTKNRKVSRMNRS